MTLLAAAFLAGFATLAVPLWLHRMSERAPAERNVSSLMLMRETEEPVRTRRRLAHRILLALRLSVLAAVTLAFAQPALEALPFGTAPTEAPAKLIVVDGSFSMRQRGAFPRALEVVRELMADGRESRVVLAADTTVVVDSTVLGKPQDPDDAAGMLRRLSGRAHDVLTGVAVRRGGACVSAVEQTAVHLAALDEALIGWYVATGEPSDKAGAYGVQGIASRFVTRVEGSYSNVVGLPLALVDRLLARLAGGDGPAR